MLLKEWSGKKDLPKTSHPTPKAEKVFKAQLSWHYYGLMLSLTMVGSRTHTHTWHHCTQTNAREGESNMRNFTYHESWGMNHVCICFQQFLDSAFLSLWYGLANASFGASICIDAVGPPHPTFRCCWTFPGVRQVVPSGPQSLCSAMPSVKSMDEGVDGWCCTVCLIWLSCTGGSFSNCGNLWHPGQHPVLIGLAGYQLIITLSPQPLNMARGFDCNDCYGCLLNFPTFPTDQHGSTVDVSIECLMDTVRSP